MNTFKRFIDGIIGFLAACLTLVGAVVLFGSRKGNKNVEQKVKDSNTKIDNMSIDSAIDDGNDLIRKRKEAGRR